MSMMVSFCAVLFPTRCLDEILNLIESVSEGFPSYLFIVINSASSLLKCRIKAQVTKNLSAFYSFLVFSL